jgi:hypothetical protein
MTKFDPVREAEIAKAIKYFLETPHSIELGALFADRTRLQVSLSLP